MFGPERACSCVLDAMEGSPVACVLVAPPQPQRGSNHATPTLVSLVEAGHGRLGVAVLDASLGSLQLGEVCMPAWSSKGRGLALSLLSMFDALAAPEDATFVDFMPMFLDVNTPESLYLRIPMPVIPRSITGNDLCMHA
eukprot:scaffold24787_cov17-Tisochrysis_lutea.AAC.1